MTLTASDKETLDIVASSLPKYPPLEPGGDVSLIHELLPDLTEEELDYVFSQYAGTLVKS